MLRQAQKIAIKYFRRKNRLISFSQPPTWGNVSAFAKRHRLRGDLLVIIAQSYFPRRRYAGTLPQPPPVSETSTDSRMGNILVYLDPYGSSEQRGKTQSHSPRRRYANTPTRFTIEARQMLHGPEFAESRALPGCLTISPSSGSQLATTHRTDHHRYAEILGAVGSDGDANQHIFR